MRTTAIYCWSLYWIERKKNLIFEKPPECSAADETVGDASRCSEYVSRSFNISNCSNGPRTALNIENYRLNVLYVPVCVLLIVMNFSGRRAIISQSGTTRTALGRMRAQPIPSRRSLREVGGVSGADRRFTVNPQLFRFFPAPPEMPRKSVRVLFRKHRPSVVM